MTTRYVALIRAVMVGREGLDRHTLLRVFADAGALDARSHLATGNVSFDLLPKRLHEATAAIDAGLSDVVGRDIEIFVRSIEQLEALEGEAVFERATIDTRDRIITFFHRPPDLSSLSLPAWVKGGTVLIAEQQGCEVYSVTREVDGKTGAPGGILERTAQQRATSRGWSTIERILRANA